jgi:hypothetical protein
MSTGVRSRTKDHWSLRLNIKRPGSGGRTVVIGLALLQALLLYLTASAQAASGGLYGCSTPCGPAAQPATPLLAVLFGVAMFVLPVAIGALGRSWPEAVTFATLPWFLAVIFTASTQLAPTAGVVPAGKGQPALSHFSAPFWLDTNQLMPLLLSLALFAVLGWLGWIGRQAVSDA